jgi:hypothetical protein
MAVIAVQGSPLKPMAVIAVCTGEPSRANGSDHCTGEPSQANGSDHCTGEPSQANGSDRCTGEPSQANGSNCCTYVQGSPLKTNFLIM